MGLGVLGARWPRRLRTLIFPVNGWSRSPRPRRRAHFQWRSRHERFPGRQPRAGEPAAAHAETENILNCASLSRLQPDGHVINVARGAHLVDADLIALLDSGHLAGATLDVFRTEPLPAGHPFWRHLRITLTPHTSARTLRDESIAQMVARSARWSVETIAGIVDPIEVAIELLKLSQ